MISAAEIQNIHEKLRAIYKNGLMLLGGSYLFGGAAEQSDLDFYLICSLKDFFYFKKYKELITPLKNQYPMIRLMIVPRFLLNAGYYYIYGRDIYGKIYISKLNRKMIFCNSLKLSYLNYLKFLACGSTDKFKCLEKTARMISAAIVLKAIGEHLDNNQPLLAPQILCKYLRNFGGESANFLLGVISKTSISEKSNTNVIDGAGNKLLDIINETLDAAGKYLSFSFVNFLLYNYIFLKKGDCRFLFSNPDIQILREIVKGIKMNTDARDLYQEMKKIVFPVFIL